MNALNHRLAELPDDLAETETRLMTLLQAEAIADATLLALPGD